MDTTDPDWAGQLRTVARDFRQLALAHPNVVPLLVTRPLATPLGQRPPGMLRPLEDVLALLTSAGFTGDDALHIYRVLFGFLHGHILNELQEIIERPEETDHVLRLGLHRLAITDFPLLRALAPVLASYDGAAELDRCLDLLLPGLTATLTRPDGSPPPTRARRAPLPPRQRTPAHRPPRPRPHYPTEVADRLVPTAPIRPRTRTPTCDPTGEAADGDGLAPSVQDPHRPPGQPGQASSEVHPSVPSPSATPPGARAPGRPDSPTSSPTPQVNDSWASARRTAPQLLPVTGGLSYFLDPAAAVDQSGDVSLGGAPLGWFQGEHQLPAGFEPAAVHLTDGITVLQPHRVFKLASPRAEAAQL